MEDVLSGLLRERPLFHGNGTASYSVGELPLRNLDALVGEGARTLETGAGDSTVLFAAKGCHHTVVTPQQSEVDAIRAYCGAHGIGLANVEFVVAASQDAFLRLDLGELDFVLIDGGHGFPVPFTDWLYTAGPLRVGGRMWIDNTDLWTGRVLRDFLKAEPGWQIVASERTYAVAEKTTPLVLREWSHQPFTRRRSRPWRRWLRHKWGGLTRRLGASVR